MKNKMTDEQMQRKLTELNEQEEIEDARIVTFMNEPHIHVDYADGAIGVVSPDGSSVSVFEG